MPESSKNGSNPERILIPSNRLKEALDEVSSVLGPIFHESVFDALERHGIDLRGTDAKYSLSDIRAKLNLLFGKRCNGITFSKDLAKGMTKASSSLQILATIGVNLKSYLGMKSKRDCCTSDASAAMSGAFTSPSLIFAAATTLFAKSAVFTCLSTMSVEHAVCSVCSQLWRPNKSASNNGRCHEDSWVHYDPYAD
jgi:hypothetical protein